MEENIKIIENGKIRREWGEKEGKWYFSIVDVIAMTGQSSDPRNYWKVLKNRLKKEQNQLVTECNQLKMKAGDGKFYLTDVADQEVILEIIKWVSEDYVLPFKLWFERLENKSYPQTKNTTNEEEESTLLVDGYRENDIFIIQAFIAGIEIENFFISATCKTVTIKGTRPGRALDFHSKEKYSYQELSWGKFSRFIILPEEIEIDRVEASEQHGKITIKLPIINKNRTKTIRVKNI